MQCCPMRRGGFLAIFRQIAPHIPVWDKSARSDGTFSRADFVFDRSRSRRASVDEGSTQKITKAPFDVCLS